MPTDPIGEIPILITGDDSGLQKTLADVVAEAQASGEKIAAAFASGAMATADFDEKMQALINSGKTTNEAMVILANQFTAVGEAANTSSGTFEKFAENVGNFIEHPLQSAGEAAKGFVEAIGPIGVVAIAASAGLAELGKAIFELVLEEANAARETQNLADRLNLSFEQTKQLGEMADVAGVNISVLQRVSMRLADALNDSQGAGKKVAEALDGMGIAASNSGDLMLKVLEHLAEIPNATERISAAHEIMGRGAVQLEPLLKNYEGLKTAVEDLGGQLSGPAVEGLVKTAQQASLLGIAWDHLKESLAATFSPAVLAGLEILTHLLTATPEMTLDKQIEALKEELKELKEQADDTAHSTSRMFAASTGMVPEAGTPANIDQRQADLDYLEAQRNARDNAKHDADAEAAAARAATLAEQEATAAAEAYAKALKGIYSTIGETDYSKLIQNTYDAKTGFISALSSVDAFNAALGKLGDAQIVDAANKLEQKLLEAFHAGAISAAEFTKQTDKIERSIADAAQAVQDAKPKLFINESVSMWNHMAEAMAQSQVILKAAASNALDFKTDLEAAEAAALKLDEYLKEAKLSPLDLTPTYSKDVQKIFIGLQDPGGTDAAMIADREALLKRLHVLNQESVEAMIADNAKLQASNLFTDQEKLKSAINTDKAILAQAQATRLGLEEQLKTQIAIKEEQGADATNEIIALEQLRQKTKALADESGNLGNVYKGLMKDFDNAFTSLTKGIADNIVDWNNWSDTLTNIGKNLAKQLLETMVTGFLNPLKNELESQGGVFDTLSKKLMGVVGLGTGKKIPSSIPGFGNANPVPGAPAVPGFGSGEVPTEGSDIGGIGGGGMPGDFGGEAGLADIVTGGGGGGDSGGGGGIGGFFSSLFGGGGGEGGGGFSPVDIALKAITGVVSGIQGAQQVHLLGEIEVSTRECKEQLVGGIQYALNTYLPELKHLVDLWGALNGLNDPSRVTMVYVMNWPGGNADNANFLLRDNPTWQNNNAPPPPVDTGDTGTSTIDTAHRFQTNVMRGGNPLAIQPFRTAPSPVIPAGPQMAPGEFVPGANPFLAATGIGSDGQPAVTTSDMKAWMAAMLANGDPSLRTKPIDPTQSYKAADAWTNIGKTADQILQHLKDTAIGSSSDQGPLTPGMISQDKNFAAELKNTADYLASPAMQRALKENASAVADYDKILQKQYADARALLAQPEGLGSLHTVLSQAQYQQAIRSGTALPKNFNVSGADIGGASTSGDRFLTQFDKPPSTAEINASLLGSSMSAGMAGGAGSAPGLADMQAKFSGEIGAVADQYFALVPGAKEAYSAGGDFKARFDAAWQSLISNGWSGDTTLDKLYNQFQTGRVQAYAASQNAYGNIGAFGAQFAGRVTSDPTRNAPGQHYAPGGPQMWDYGASGGGGGGSYPVAYVSVNALDLKSQSVTQAITKNLITAGVKTK